MKSSWAWMMVLVALGSGLIRAKPQIDVRMLSGTWYPLATAWTRLLTNPVPEYKIQSNDPTRFYFFVPEESKCTCKEEMYTYIAKGGGVFQKKGGFHRINFVDTDYDNYLIMIMGLNPKPVLYLYARKKDLTEEMTAKFQIQVLIMGYKQKYINYRPEIFYC